MNRIGVGTLSTLMLGALLLAPDAWALQPVCVNSPENPTLVLGLVGAAAAGYPLLRDKARGLLRRRRDAIRGERQP